MSMANVSLVGNLVKAPEQVCFASGRVKTTLVVAVNNPNRGSNQERMPDTADFYRVETWGKLAELAQKYLAKGNQVGISGRLIMEHWTDKQGRERLTPVVAAAQLSLPPRLSTGINEAEPEDKNEDSNSRDKTHYEEPEENNLRPSSSTLSVKELPPSYKTRRRA